ncbi:MAG: hypothetical protein ACO20H_11920 [Bacteriovoracaceae bacterium]
MGLLYILPLSKEEYPLVQEVDELGPSTIKIESYNLPKLFFLYYIAIMSTLFILAAASHKLIIKLYQTQDWVNQLLALSVWAVLFVVPLIMTSMWFYKKTIMKKGAKLQITRHLFGITFSKKVIDLTKGLEVIQNLESPNIAKIKNDPNMKGFQNRGHFLLLAHHNKGHLILDRHSSKTELDALKSFLESY